VLVRQARTRPTQGELVEGVLGQLVREQLTGGSPLVDVGINLMDRAYDKVVSLTEQF